MTTPALDQKPQEYQTASIITTTLDQKLQEYQAERDQLYIRVCSSNEYQRMLYLDGAIAVLTEMKPTQEGTEGATGQAKAEITEAS